MLTEEEKLAAIVAANLPCPKKNTWGDNESLPCPAAMLAKNMGFIEDEEEVPPMAIIVSVFDKTGTMIAHEMIQKEEFQLMNMEQQAEHIQTIWPTAVRFVLDVAF